jgi:hexosaminidase
MHPLMPIPAKTEFGDGGLIIDSTFHVKLSGIKEARIERAVRRFTKRLFQMTGIPVCSQAAQQSAGSQLLIHVEEGPDKALGTDEDESYTLDININQVELRSRKFYGILRGIETFLQLVCQTDKGFVVPVAHIEDAPRFGWRGLLIDSTRHWIPVDVIKRNLDAMATVKLNVLHWHLTDDQGFRIESRRYPKLHELGSDGLYYTQDEVREIVELAHDRGIRVLPEFDMPAHAGSWFVGYPELASAPGPYQIARHYGGLEATMDPTREETYDFIKNFLSEMTTLFPDKYIHIGGDQVNDKQWRENPEITKFMEKEAIKDNRQLQAYFNRRLHGILQELDRELIGWDPILHPDLPKGCVVQTVRGQQWLVDAVRRGYQVVAGSEYYLTQMKPAAFHYTSDPTDGGDENLTMEQQKLVLGGEASIWTELVTAENIDSRTWPRAAAIAERFWSPQHVTDVDDMYQRLAVVNQQLETIGLKHQSGPNQMIQRLMNYKHIEPLHTLVNVVQPVNSGLRRKAHNYNVTTPFNRLVDTAIPESDKVRQFNQTVEMFLDAPQVRSVYNILKKQFETWKDNHSKLIDNTQGLSLLNEVEPLSMAFSKVAEVGLLSLETIHYKQNIMQNEQTKYLQLLEEKTAPIAELELMIIGGVQRLVHATPINA